MSRKKRGHGEGSIYKTADGSWPGAISIGWKTNANGKKVWKRRIVTGSTRHEVPDQMNALLGDRQRGFNIDPRNRPWRSS
jgi:integrase